MLNASRKSAAKAANWVLLPGACLLANQPTHAAEADSLGDPIVVTAERREGTADDTAIALSVLTGDALRLRKASQADDLALGLANVQSTATVGENTPLFAIRGISVSDFSLNQSSSVALYYDDVYKGNFALMGLALYDLDRVEVLRGPQGALYGRNATGGAISLVSRMPRFANEGEATLGIIGNFDRVEAEGAANVVLGDRLAARIAFTAGQADGWFRNLLPGKPDLNATREYGVRTSLRWDDGNGSEVLLRLSTSLQTPHNYASLSLPGPDGIGAGVYEAYDAGSSYFRPGLEETEVEANFTPRRKARTWSASLTGTFEIGGSTLTSISAWDRGTLYVPEDTDASPLRVLEIPYTDRASQLSQEVRLSGPLPGAGSFVGGLYAAREQVFNATTMTFWGDIDVDGNGRVDSADCDPAALVACVFANRFDQRKTSLAAYADGRWPLGERLTLNTGLRLTHDTGRQYGLVGEARGVDGAVVATLIPPTERRFGQTDLSGKAMLEWRPGGGLLAWASVGNAFRGSAFNGQAFFDVAEAGVASPEKVLAAELGIKGLAPAPGVRLGLTGFAYRYDGQQFLSVNPANAVQNLVNVERSRIVGMEGEVVLEPVPGLRIDLAGGWLATKVLEGEVSGQSIVGNRLLNAPSATGSAQLSWRAFADGARSITLSANAAYTGDQFFEIRNTPRLKEPGYVLLGASLVFESGPLRVILWGKNLSDRRYYTSRIDLSGFGFDYGHLGTPRTYGVLVTQSF